MKSSGTLYWRALGGDALAETDASGNITSEYVFFAGRRLARRDASGNTFYYFTDHLGTTRSITQSNGAVCYDADFTPYGQEINHTNSCPQNYKFTGYERDPETGLDYAFARYYNPRLARFMSPDPLFGSRSSPQSFNRYAYVSNHPMNSTDPAGLREHPVSACYDMQFSSLCGGGMSCAVDGIATSCGIVQSLLGAGAAVQCPDNICSGVGLDANGNWVFEIFRASTNGNGAYFPVEGPGWEFSSEAEALAAGALWAAAETRDNGVENCGMTYSTGNGQYSFTGSVEGHLASCQPLNAGSFIPSGATPDGGYHSHPNDPNYLHERFSGQPGDYNGLGGDVGWSRSNNLPFGYPISLGTPEGRVIIYYPGGNCQVFVIGSPTDTGTTIPICQ